MENYAIVYEDVRETGTNFEVFAMVDDPMKVIEEVKQVVMRERIRIDPHTTMVNARGALREAVHFKVAKEKSEKLMEVIEKYLSKDKIEYKPKQK